MQLIVKQKFDSYPDDISELLLKLRAIILLVAEEDGIENITETLKWDEPSYIAKNGSTVRFNWKQKSPKQYYLYFNCKTQLIDTFKEIYGDTFKYEGNRAIIFDTTQEIPTVQLKHCISMSLRYHKIKHLPLLGS